MAGLSPMMQQYMETKEQYKDCLLFYRLGDFYEMFFEDAKTASAVLDITLTGKECGLPERAPMCGIPYHAVDVYLDKLIKAGYKVAIAEQMEDPKLAKGLVKREVIRIVTPGTIVSEQALEEGKNHYLCCAYYSGRVFGISFADVSTGDFSMTEVDDAKVFLDEVEKYSPAEMIFNDAFYISGVDLDDLKIRLHMSVSALPAPYFAQDSCEKALTSHFQTESLASLGLTDYEFGLLSAGALMQYLTETQKNNLAHITKLTPYQTGRFMILDSFTRRNLELVETMREKQKRGTLLWVLDRTKTAMGARLLRAYIEQPLLDKREILARQDAIEELNRDYITREELSEYLSPIYDLERLLGRISYKSANPRDLIAFRNSIRMIPPILDQLKSCACDELKTIVEEMDPLTDLEEKISAALVEDPPILVREGGMIREGYNETADHLRNAKTEGKEWLADLEQKEKERTGIRNLRIRYNKVFGYYIEISNSNLGMVPEDYTRKQTLTTGERFTTTRLKELEETILGAEDKLFALEYDLFVELRETIAAEVVRIQTTAKAIAKLDVFVSLAKVAEKYGYVRPKINEKGVIDIKDGRHPVVEQMMKEESFVANDTHLDGNHNRIAIITGPNMAGKSTYMRQTALIVLMAQMGSFVPASEANVAICDRIFTRVGASDDLASGRSTFMVEMTEVANILRNATKKSLLILDEIGRGTSTFDGLSIAWAVVEHIANPRILGAKTLFATHYHELTEMEGTLPGVNNYCIAVKEMGDDIIFLRKIIRGGADKSYGIQVAKLAGIPEEVIARAKVIAQELTSADITVRSKETEMLKTPAVSRPGKPDEVDLSQMTLFDAVNEDSIAKEIEEMDLSRMTPIDALNRLYTMQASLKNRWQKGKS